MGSITLKENAVSVCFNKSGEQLFALYRGLSPCLFDLHEPKPVQCFVNDSYRNMVTLKSGCFMGSDDEVRSQSSSCRGIESVLPAGSLLSSVATIIVSSCHADLSVLCVLCVQC